MAVVGYATVAVVPSLRGITAEVERSLAGPIRAAAKNAGVEMRTQLAAAATTAARDVQKARNAEVKAAADVEAQERKLMELRSAQEAQAGKIEVAEKQLEAARAAAVAKVMAAEQAFEKVRNDSKSTVEQVALAEKKLEAAREAAAATVAAKEAALDRERAKAFEQVKKVTNGERDLKRARQEASEATARVKERSEELAKAQAHAQGASEKLADKLRRIGAEAQNLDSPLGGVMGKLKGLAGLAVAGATAGGIGSFFSGAIENGRELDAVMGSLQAVTASNAETMARVSERAKQLGMDESLAGTSAASATDAMLALAKGGMSVSDAMEAAKGSIQLAGAAQIDAGQAADIQIAALNSFGLAAGEAGRVADVLTNTANSAATDVATLAESLKYAAPTASTLGISLEDTSTMIGLFANNGVKGSEAGTAFRSSLLSMVSPSKQQAKALAELGVEALNSEGKFVGLAKVSDQLKAAHARMGDAAFTAAAATAFGREAVGFATTAAKGGSEAFEQLRRAMDRQGSAGETAGAKLAGLNGAIERMSNAMDDAKQRVYEVIAPTLAEWADKAGGAITRAAEGFGVLVGWLRENKAELQHTAVAVGITATALAVLHGSAQIVAAGGLLAWMKQLTVVTKVQAAATAVLNAVMNANPIARIITLVAALVSGMVYFFTQTETGRKALEALRPVVQNVIDFFQMLWDKLKQVGAAIVTIIAPWAPIFKGAFDRIKEIAISALATMGELFKANFEAIKNVFQTGWEIVKTIFATAWAVIVAVFTGKWGEIDNIIGAGWATIKQKFSEGMARAREIAAEGLSRVSGKFRETYEKIKAHLSLMVEAIKSAFKNAPKWLYDAGVKIIAGLFDGLKRKWEEVKSWFSNIGQSISGFFSNATSSAHQQISYQPPSSRRSGRSVPFYAGGGALPKTGPMSHMVDPILAVNRAGMPIARVDYGEYVVNRASTEKYLPLLESINAGTLPGYNRGGKVTPLDLLRFARGERVNGYQASRSLEAAKYVFGGINWGDCSSTQAALARFTQGLSPFATRFATGNQGQALQALGAKPGMGEGPRLVIGWYHGYGPGGGHTSSTLHDGDGKSINLEMGGRRGNGQIGGGAAPATHPQYKQRMWIPLANAGAGLAGGAIESTSTAGITYSNGATSTSVSWGQMQDVYNAFLRKSHLYDRGGWLKHGMAAVNLSGASEAVLTATQWATFQRGIDVMTQFMHRVAASESGQAVIAGVKGFFGEFRVVRESEEALLATRRQVALENKAVADAEKDLARLKEKLSKSERNDLKDVEKAERELAKARKPNKKGKVDADKVLRAEERLAKAREKVPEKSRDAAEKIAAAEQKVQEAREKTANQAQKLKAAEMTYFASYGRAALDFAQVAVHAFDDPLGAAKKLSELTDNADVGMIIETIQFVLGIFKRAFDAMVRARTAVRELFATWASGVREVTLLLERQASAVALASAQVAQAKQALVAATRQERLAYADMVRSRLLGVRKLHQAEKSLRGSADSTGRALGKTGLAYDRFIDRERGLEQATGARIAAEAEGVAQAVGAAETMRATRLEAFAEEQKAALKHIQLMYAQKQVMVEMEEAQARLTHATEMHNRLMGKSFGMDSKEAVAMERVAKLMAENAKLQGERDSIGTQIRSALGRLLDWNGDGMIFGTIPNILQNQVQIFDDAIQKNNELIEAIRREGFANISDEQKALMNDLIDRAGNLYSVGQDKAAETLLMYSRLGDAARALEDFNFRKQLADIDLERVQNTLNLKKLRLKEEEFNATDKLDSLVNALSAGANAEKYLAEAAGESAVEAKKALVDLAEFEKHLGREFLSVYKGEKKQIVVNVPEGNGYTADDMIRVLDHTLGELKHVKYDIRKLKQGESKTASEIALLLRDG